MYMARWMDNKNRSDQGFTLVEILIVIVVIGILAAIGVISYSGVQRNARDTAIKADLIKISDAVKLKSLDDNSTPVGGSTSALVGDPSALAGISILPNKKSYDATIANVYYCQGVIDGNNEFGIVARSLSKRAFSYVSNKGITELTGYNGWTTTVTDGAICIALGFTAPYTWSYGTSPLTGWSGWTTPG